MKVVHVKPVPVESTVTLELTSIETGWLRTILGSYVKREAHPDGFAATLFNKLNDLSLDDYESKYPDWRKKL